MAISSGKKLHGIHPSKQGNAFLFRRSNFYFIFLTTDDLSDAYKRLKRLIMEYLGMSPPSTVHSDLFSGSMTSVDTSQSEDTLHRADKSGTSQTTSITVNMAVRTWSRPSDSSILPSKGIKLKQHRTPVVREVLHVNIFFITKTIFCQLLVYHSALHKLTGVKDNFEASIISVELVVRVLSKLAIHSLLTNVHLTWRYIPFFALVPPSRKPCHLSVDRPKPRRQWREFIRFHWSNSWLQGRLYTITETDNCWRLPLYNFAVYHVTKSSSSPY